MNRRLAGFLAVASACALSVGTASACNKRVFEKVINSCDRTIASDVDVPTEKAADILIVVDNSGSMQEEQTNLANNFFNENAGECPLQDLANIDEAFKNPARQLYQPCADAAECPLAQCGFIQLLAAFENDFHVGVITSDVGLCDNRFPSQQAQIFCNGAGAGTDECSGADALNKWGFRPQRGCLQPDGPPDSGANKLITKADLSDPGKSDLAGRFKDTLNNIRTFGSPFEQGLEAMKAFLKTTGTRGPGCGDDLNLFRRADAQLVVIFLSDEEDCSHGSEKIPAGTNGALVDENLDPDTGELFLCDDPDAAVLGQPQFFQNNARGCYDGEDDLPGVSGYADFLKGIEENAKVAIIAGGLGEPGSVEAGGCVERGTPDGACFESGGLSNFASGDLICSDNPADTPQNAAAIAGRGCADGDCDIPCCQADAGDRYFRFAGQFSGKALTDSICNETFRQTMLDIAAFIAAVDFVELAEKPTSPDAVVVSILRTDGSTDSIAPLGENDDCATETGWQLEGERRIVLCGDARPGPGDKVQVRARGGGGTDTCGG